MSEVFRDHFCGHLCYLDFIMQILSQCCSTSSRWRTCQIQKNNTDLKVKIPAGTYLFHLRGVVVVEQGNSTCEAGQRGNFHRVRGRLRVFFYSSRTSNPSTISLKWKDDRIGEPIRKAYQSAKSVIVVLSQSESRTFQIAICYDTL